MRLYAPSGSPPGLSSIMKRVNSDAAFYHTTAYSGFRPRLLIFPATNATSERSVIAFRHLKTVNDYFAARCRGGSRIFPRGVLVCMMSEKKNEPYSVVLAHVRPVLAFSLVRSAVASLRGHRRPNSSPPPPPSHSFCRPHVSKEAKSPVCGATLNKLLQQQQQQQPV